jgi:MFS family permease
MTSIAIILPVVRKELMVTESSLGLIGGAASLGMLLTFIAGRLSDRFGRLVILGAGNLTMIFGTGIAYFAHDSTLLFVAIFLQSVGVALIESSINTMMAEIHAGSSGRALGIYHGVWAMGAITGPALLTYMISVNLDWHHFYLAYSLAYALVFGSSFVILKKIAYSSKSRILKRGPTKMTATELRLVVLFIFAAFLVSGVHTGIGAWLSSYLIIGKGFSIEWAGTTFILFMASVGIGRFVSASFVDRLGYRNVMFAASILAATSILIALTMNVSVFLIGSWCVAGLFLSPCLPTLVTRANVTFPAKAGFITGIIFTFMAVGGFVSTWFIGILIQSFSLYVGMVFIALELIMIATLQIVERGWKRSGDAH